LLRRQVTSEPVSESRNSLLAGILQGISSFGARRRVNGSKKERCTRGLQANSLRIGTGNLLRPCREFKLAIREISAVIRESRSRPLFWGRAILAAKLEVERSRTLPRTRRTSPDCGEGK